MQKTKKFEHSTSAVDHQLLLDPSNQVAQPHDLFCR